MFASFSPKCGYTLKFTGTRINMLLALTFDNPRSPRSQVYRGDDNKVSGRPTNETIPAERVRLRPDASWLSSRHLCNLLIF
jgi:hypothetical protein